jgi:CRP/FNR family transcriptional regulator
MLTTDIRPAVSARLPQKSAPAAKTIDDLELPDHLGRNVAMKRDQTVFWEGDPANSYYRVVSGAVRICKLMPDGRRQVTDFFTSGDMIVLDFAEKYGVTAEAVTDCVVRQYPRTAILGLLNSDPRLSRQMLTLACRRLISAQHQMMTLGRKRAEERLATFLLGLAERQPRRGARIELPMSRADIADYLGLTVETVSRELTKLRQQDVITLPNTHSVTIIDVEALEQLGEGVA